MIQIGKYKADNPERRQVWEMFIKTFNFQMQNKELLTFYAKREYTY